MGAYVDQVRACLAEKKPGEALLILAEALDALEAAGIGDGMDWSAPAHADLDYAIEQAIRKPGPDGLTDHERAQHEAAQLAMANDGPRDYSLPSPSEEKMEFRRMFERQQLNIAGALGEDAAGEEDWTEAYAKGGPWWFYCEMHEMAKSLPYPARQMMVADIEQDNPALAHEVSLDLLKQETGEPDLENGSGALAVATVSSKSVRR